MSFARKLGLLEGCQIASRPTRLHPTAAVGSAPMPRSPMTVHAIPHIPKSMTYLALIATACAATASVLFLLQYCYRPCSLRKSVTKTTSTALLALAAGLAGGPVLLVLALALGALGDLLLSRDGERAFLAGLVAFAAAHILYVALFVTDGGADVAMLQQGWRLPAALGLLAFGGAMGRLLWPAAGALRWPVLVYVGIILALGLAALALPDGPASAARTGLVLAGAGAFVVSDAILASEVFLIPQTHPLRRVTPFAVWASYWGAQALFLAAFCGPTGGAIPL